MKHEDVMFLLYLDRYIQLKRLQDQLIVVELHDGTRVIGILQYTDWDFLRIGGDERDSFNEYKFEDIISMKSVGNTEIGR